MRTLLAMLVALASASVAAPAAAESPDDDGCYDALDDLGVEYRPARRRGIERGVVVDGPLGGVSYVAYRPGVPLILDCSLVYSLAMVGPFLTEHGIQRVRYSSAFDRRNIRGTHRPSKHSFGLAIDVHTFHREDQALLVKEDYEQGLGDDLDCIGQPLTESGRVLRTVDCQLTRSQLFRIVLTPDFDADHYNHFHLEARRWQDRKPVEPTDPEPSSDEMPEGD